MPHAVGVSSGGTSDTPAEVRLLFAGDVLLSRGVEHQLVRNPQALARALHSSFAGADWVVGNLEGAVGSPDDCPASERQGPCFPIRDEFIPLLKGAGFKAIGLANNHSSDLGRTAREKTRRLLIENNLAPLTFEESPRFIRFGDITVGLVSLSMVPGRDEPSVDVPGEWSSGAGTELRQKLRVAKNLSNLVVVYIHWGSEFLDWPDKKQRQAADWLVRNGGDIIVGHHPHIVQEPECLRGKPVFYSLGNLVFDQKYPSTHEGLLADCRIRGNEVSCSALRTLTPAGSTLPIIGGAGPVIKKGLSGSAMNQAAPVVGAIEPCGAKAVSDEPYTGMAPSECTLTLAPSLRVGGISLKPEITPIKDSSSGFLLEAVQEGKALWKTRHAKLVSIEKMVSSAKAISTEKPASTGKMVSTEDLASNATEASLEEPASSESMESAGPSRTTDLQSKTARPRMKTTDDQPKFAGPQPRIAPPQPAEYLFTLERHFSPMDGEDGLRPCVYEVSPRGLIPRWRGTALAWPLIDAAFLPVNSDILCALHRGDSFVVPGSGSKEKRIAAYRWKGFGFSGIQDEETIRSCRDYFQ